MEDIVVSDFDKPRWDIIRWSLMPGSFMHASWWQYLGLERWQSAYQVKGHLSRQIDHFIRQRLALDFVVTELFSLTEEQQILYRISGRWPLLLTSLGLLQIGCPDYLLLRKYRLALENIISGDKLNQVVALWRGGDSEPELAPEDLAAVAAAQGCFMLNTVLQDDPIWKLMRLQFARYDGPEEEMTSLMATNVLAELRRLERFL